MCVCERERKSESVCERERVCVLEPIDTTSDLHVRTDRVLTSVRGCSCPS